MSSSGIRIGLITALLVTGLAIGLHAQRDDSRPLSILGRAQYEACGLDKLTRGEQETILGLMTASPARSFLEESAFSLLENDGWTQVNVLGAIPKGSEHAGQYLLVVHHSEFFTLDPSIVPYTPDPGLYWAKINGYSWTLLYPDGKEGNFWVRDLD